MRGLLFAALFGLIIMAQGESFNNLLQDEWLLFKVNYNKSYSNVIEEEFRMKIFAENAKMIAQHNVLFDRGETSFAMKMTKFGDLLPSEFARRMQGYQPSKSSKRATFIAPDDDDDVMLPESVDWREKGAVTHVKDQSECNSDYAFAATGALEGQHFLKTGKLVSLSEQNVIDCTRVYGNNGCEEGLIQITFVFISYNKGIDTEESYPYEGLELKCRFKNTSIGATMKNYNVLPFDDEQALKKAVAQIGPIATSIDATKPSFHFYSHGIYDEPKCRKTRADFGHNVLVVGYGTSKKGLDYWLVKNSWGDKWGEEGYIRMRRNNNNMCRIADRAMYPTLHK